MDLTELLACRGLIVLFALVFGAGVAAAQEAAVRLGPNLLHNGSFEYTHADGTLAGWTVQWAWQHSPNEASVTAETAYHGDRSLYTAMRSTSVPQGWGGRVYQDVPVTAGATYEVSVAVKMRNWRSQATKEGVGVSILWQFANGRWSESAIVTEELFTGDFDWRVFTARITAPPGAAYVRLALWANAGAGEIWWDDVQLREVLGAGPEPAEDEAAALAAQLERTLEASLAEGLARVAEVDWREVRRLYDEASLAIATFRSTPSPYNEAAARQAVHDVQLALLGSRVAEARAYWIDDQALRTLRGRQDVAVLLDALQALGVNTIYPNVYFDSRAIYPSDVAGQSPAFYAWTEDPLQVLIEEAHARGMEVHAWYVMFAASHGAESLPSFLLRRVDWLARDRDNGIFGEAGIIWYDPAHPAVQEFLLNLLREGMERYPLDGIHLDYIRYDSVLKYGPATVEGFRTATGLDAKALPAGSSEAQAFRQYTQNVITEFVAKVKALRDEVRPQAYLSAAVAAPYSWAINTRSQDWPEWARRGLIDYLVPMVYTADTAEFVSILDETLRLIGGHVPVEVGIASYALRLDQFGDQINAVRERDTIGSALFAAVHLQHIPSMARELAAGVFRRPAVSARSGERAAEVFLRDLVTRLRDQADLFTEEGPQAEALRRLADAIARDPAQALRTLDVYALPQVSRDAIRRQLEYALRLGNTALTRRTPATASGTSQISRLRIELDNALLMTTTEPSVTVAGRLYGYNPGQDVRVVANGLEAAVADDGRFSVSVPLTAGTNYIDVAAYVQGALDTMRSLVVFYKVPRPKDRQEVFLWVEQGPNARRFQTSEDVYNTLLAAKEAGITAVILDVKGVEGYAAYKKNDLTGRPYVSEITSPTRRGASADLDLLEEFIRHGHDLGLAVYASLNAFAEGSIAHNAFAVLNQHLDWEEVVYRPEDNGRLLRLRESSYGRSGASVAFVNPAHPEVRAFELRSFEEVLKNYDIDGIIIDRGRYDNIFADFSEVSRAQFEAYLASRGKVLRRWPDDIFTYEGDRRVEGPLWFDWLTYRASVIRSFVGELRALVDDYNARTGRNVQLGAYVGSWYETMYLHGINWASPNFVYDRSLQLPQPDLYTEEYRATSYLADLDLLLIGTYQSTPEEVRRYIALANVVTGAEIPVYAGMALANLRSPQALREAFQAGLTLADGLMIFDLAQANFPMIRASLAGHEYVKEYQLGVSNPRDPESFIEAHFLNQNRNEDNINVYTSAYGPTTNTSTWGVEVIVDASGKVLYIVNKFQAMFWNWTGVQQNNSPIPQGGFVISAEDPSGQRTNRQLIANAYRAGDEVRAAMLKGLDVYDGFTTSAESILLTGSVEVIGPGTPMVYVNGEAVSVDESGTFTVTVPLEAGANAIEVVVRVDGLLTNRKTVTVIRMDG